MKIGIICAMESEQRQVKALLEDVRDFSSRHWKYAGGNFCGHQVALAKSGVGKVNAASQATNMIENLQPDILLNTGVAGGIDSSLCVMDVVVGEKTAYHDVDCGPDVLGGQIQDMPLFFEADARLYEAAMHAGVSSSVRGGLICTGDQFVTDRRQLEKIKSRFPDGLAVDMESAALAQVCHIYKVPFLSFRIISDTPGVEGHIDQYFNFWEEMANRSFAATRAFLEEISKLGTKFS